MGHRLRRRHVLVHLNRRVARSTLPELWSQHIAPFLLVLSRLGGLFVFTPLLSSAAVPARVRVLLAVMFAAMLYPLLAGTGGEFAAAAAGTFDLPSLALLVVSEALVGVTIGFLAAIPVLAVQIGGMVMGQQLGLGLAGVFNPAMETEGDLLGELLLYMAMAVFMAFGGLEIALIAVAQSFGSIPPGAMGAADAPVGMVVALIHAGFELALRVAAPVLCILMLETLAAGLIMKTMPQLNVLSIGFAVKIVVGIMAMIAAVYAVGDAVREGIESGLRAVLMWSTDGAYRGV